jgi:hypothetical protein
MVANALVRYSTAEEAFLLSYADYCIVHGLDYKHSVCEEFARVAQRPTTWSRVRDKLSALLSNNGKSGAVKDVLAGYLAVGTKSLNIKRLRLEVMEHITKQLAEWEINKLEVDRNTGVESESKTLSNHSAPEEESTQVSHALRASMLS